LEWDIATALKRAEVGHGVTVGTMEVPL
jgi:hypothetical protein